MTLETEKVYAANIEVQGQEENVLGGGDPEKTGRLIQDSADCILVRVVGVYRTPVR